MPSDATTRQPGLPKDMHHSGWVVTDQLTDQVIVTQAGQAITGVQIFFRTGNGNEGSIFVADNHYVPKVVKPAIDTQAALVDTIGDLAGNPL